VYITVICATDDIHVCNSGWEGGGEFHFTLFHYIKHAKQQLRNSEQETAGINMPIAVQNKTIYLNLSYSQWRIHIFFKKPFFRVKGIHFVVRICDK